ncbi:hypothetical protein Tco_0300476 [Tanacetum coccineum]
MVDPCASMVDPSRAVSTNGPIKLMGLVPLVDALLLSNPKPILQLEPIIWDIRDEEEEYPFVNEYPSFKKEPIMFVEDESCLVYDTDNEEKESMPVCDTDIEDVIKEEEGCVGKGGFC